MFLLLRPPNACGVKFAHDPPPPLPPLLPFCPPLLLNLVPPPPPPLAIYSTEFIVIELFAPFIPLVNVFIAAPEPPLPTLIEPEVKVIFVANKTLPPPPPPPPCPPPPPPPTTNTSQTKPPAGAVILYRLCPEPAPPVSVVYVNT